MRVDSFGKGDAGCRPEPALETSHFTFLLSKNEDRPISHIYSSQTENGRYRTLPPYRYSTGAIELLVSSKVVAASRFKGAAAVTYEALPQEIIPSQSLRYKGLTARSEKLTLGQVPGEILITCGRRLKVDYKDRWKCDSTSP